MCSRADTDVHAERITPYNPSGRVQQVHVRDARALRIERPLHDQRAAMGSTRQPREWCRCTVTARGTGIRFGREPERELGTPA